MPDKKEFALGDYIEVRDRIAILYELYPGARLVTDEVTMLTAPDNKQRIMVRAKAYRSVDDPLPGVGYSWLELPGNTPYTKGSELENAETSAWGRAIAALGILIDKSIATRQEIDAKKGTPARTVDQETGEIHDPDAPHLEVPDAVVKGVVSFGNPPVDGGLRQTPDGWRFGFRLTPEHDKLIPQVMAENQLADDLAAATSEVSLDGQTIIAHGDIYRVPWKKAGKPMPPFQRLVLTRIVTDVWSLPNGPTHALPADEADELDALPF